MARRRTLGPALQFFCFSVFGTSKGRLGTSTDIGTMPYSFSDFLFFSRSKEHFWHVDGHWDHALQFFCFLFFSGSKGHFWHVDGHWNQSYSFSVFFAAAAAICDQDEQRRHKICHRLRQKECQTKC